MITNNRSRRAHRMAVVGLLGAMVLAGCSTVTPFQKPNVPLPMHWTAAKDVSPTREQDNWWTQFGSPQLNDLVSRGLDDGLTIKIALARLEQARGLAQIAGAGRYPTLSAGLSGSRGSSASSPKQTASLTGSLDLDIWGQNAAKADSAIATAQASAFDLETARQTLAANIALSYFQLLALDERIQLSHRIADDASHQLQLVETQSKFGAASALDVEQQRNNLQTFLAATPLLIQQRDTLRGQLAVLVNTLPQAFRVAPESFLEMTVPQVQAIAPSTVVASRPEVLAAEAHLKAANFDVGVARAAFLPKVSLTAELGTLFNPAQALWSVGGSLLQPLFDAGALQGQLHVDRAHAEELVATYRQTILQVLQEAEAQLVAVQRLKEAEVLDQAAVHSAGEALRLSRIRYDHGAYDMLTIIVNERNFYQAQDTLLQARMQRLQATVNLLRAYGGKAGATAVADPSTTSPAEVANADTAHANALPMAALHPVP